MTYLLDTCIVAELISEIPNPNVIRWVDAQPEETLFISVVTLAELKNVIDREPSLKRRSQMNEWLTNDLLVRFSNRVSEINVNVTLKWGEVSARIQSLDRVISAMDTLNLAIALIYDHTLVTNHLNDFENTGVRLVNAFEVKP
jgi:toxin FitB